MEGWLNFIGLKIMLDVFIVKEITTVGKSYKTYVLFRCTYDMDKLNPKMRRTARWLSRYFHHIKWNDGDFEYNGELYTPCVNRLR